MATSAEYVEFVCEQLGRFGAVRSRKMFGEYMVYVNDKPVLLVCDNTAFVRELPEAARIMTAAECGVPYHGAKEHFVLDVEDTELLERLIPVLVAATPFPKPRKKKK